MFKVVRWYDAAAGQEAGPEGERAVRDDGVVAQGHEGQIVANAAIEWRTISWGQSYKLVYHCKLQFLVSCLLENCQQQHDDST